MPNLDQSTSDCNTTDHVLKGYCANCPAEKQLAEPADFEGYAEYLSATETPVYLTPEMLGGALCGEAA